MGSAQYCVEDTVSDREVGTVFGNNEKWCTSHLVPGAQVHVALCQGKHGEACSLRTEGGREKGGCVLHVGGRQLRWPVFQPSCGTYLAAATRAERYLLPRGRAASPLCLLVSSLFIFVSFLDRDHAAAAVRPVQTTKVPRAIVPSYPHEVPSYSSTLVPARPSMTWIRPSPLHAAFSSLALACSRQRRWAILEWLREQDI